jgi:hypothetical protein
MNLAAKALLILALALPLGCAGTRVAPPVSYPSTVASIAPELAVDPDLREIRGQYEALAVAFAAQDEEAIMRLHSKDYQAIFPGGERLDAAQMRKSLSRVFIGRKPPLGFWFTMLSAERAGPDTVRVQVFKQASSNVELARKLRKVEQDGTERETWCREGQIWRVLASDSMRDSHCWVDGKPVHPSKLFDPHAPPYVPGKDEAEVRRELEQQYQKLVEAHAEGPKAFASLLTADFHAIDSDGRIEDLRAMKQAYAETYSARARYTILELAVSENRLIAVVEVFREITEGRTVAGAPRKIVTSSMKRDTWSRTRKGWKLKSVDHIRDQKKFVDGKRVDPTKPFDPDAPPYEPAEEGNPSNKPEAPR